MHRILIVATRHIGDVLLTTPLIRLARTTWPLATIDVIGFTGTLGMLRGNPDIQTLVETPHRLGFFGFWKLIIQNWRRYDLALVTQASDRAHLIGMLLAKVRSGIIPEHHGSNWWKKTFLRHVVRGADDLGNEHVVIEKLKLLSPWAEAPICPEVIPPPPVNLPAHLQQLLEKGAVVVHAPSMWEYKQWPVDNYCFVVKELLKRGRQVVITGSNNPRDQACIAPLLALAPSPKILNTAGQLDFNQLVSLFAQTAVYVGPDTSVSHLAAACGTAVVAIFGPISPARWAPWPVATLTRQTFKIRSTTVQTIGNVTLLQNSQACVPCGKAGCQDHTHSQSECLDTLPPQMVLVQIFRLLDTQHAP